MSQQPGFDPSFAEALQSNMAIKMVDHNSGATSRQHADLEEKLQAAENEVKGLRNGIEAMASDLLEARNEAKKAHEAKEQLELSCTKLSQEVESLRTALQSERRSQAKLRQAQTRATTLEQQSQQQQEQLCHGEKRRRYHHVGDNGIYRAPHLRDKLLVNNKMTSEEMQFDNFQKATTSQAADIGKLQELVRFYKANSERLSAEIQQFKEQSEQH